MEYVGHKKAVLCYALSKDGKRLLTGGGDGKIMLWNTVTGDSLQSIESYQEPIFDIHFNSDETQVITSSWDARMKIHDLQTGKLITYFDFQNNSVYNLIFHPNDLYVFTARLDNTLQLWEIDTHKEVRNFIGHTDIISGIHLSADQKILLSCGWDGSIRLWDVGTGLMTKKFKGHTGAVHAAIFSPEGSSIYSAGADRIIRVWDINTTKVIRTFEGHNAEVTSLLFSPDNKMLVSHSLDGVTKFWDLSSGKEFFEHIHFGERDWMVKNPEGYFNGTSDARKHIHFVSGMKTYSVDQFFTEFYRPDLLPKIFQNRGGNDNLKGIQGKLNSSPPPTVKVAIVPSGAGRAELLVRITDNGAGAENLRIFHNGKSILLNRDLLKMPASKGQFTTYKHSIDLIGGTNTFTATASNKDKVESDPQSAEIFSEHSSKSSTCYILSVGINKYKNPRMTLNYAKPDAESFSNTMNTKSVDLFKKVELVALYDEDATREKILSTLDELKDKINQEDVFIFYYAGHGSMVDDKFYFIPTESVRLYEASALNKEAIEAALLQDKFKNIKALKQLIIMDACQSGGTVELLATRGASEEKAIAQLSRSAGIHVMASAGSEQFATEFAELGHGLFTYVLIKALQGDADGSPKDGKVTIYELKSYIDDQVPEMTRKLKGKPQYPYTFSRGQDFPIVIEE
jgi:WD40 repeat protein